MSQYARDLLTLMVTLILLPVMAWMLVPVHMAAAWVAVLAWPMAGVTFLFLRDELREGSNEDE